MKRTPLEMIMFAAWVNVDPENVPEKYKGISVKIQWKDGNVLEKLLSNM